MSGNGKGRRTLRVGVVVVALALGVAGCSAEQGKVAAKGAAGAAAGAGGVCTAAGCK